MSSRATSVRPPYITIRSSRARAPSYIPPSTPPPSTVPSSGIPVEDALDSPSRYSQELDTEYTTMPRAVLASIISLFSAKSEHHMYSLSSSATSSADSLSLPLPASPQQATFGTDVWQEEGRFRTGGCPTSRETRSWWSGGISVCLSCDLKVSCAHCATEFHPAFNDPDTLSTVCTTCSCSLMFPPHHCVLPAHSL